MMRPFQSTKSKVIAAVLIALAVPMGAISYMGLFQESFLFHPRMDSPDQKIQTVTPHEEIWKEVDGLKIHSLFFPNNGAKTLILYFHGNAGTIGEPWARVADTLAANLHVAVWLMDYPGFGLSEGHIKNQEQIMNIAEAFFAAIPERGKFDRVFLMGRSMGTGVAAELAARKGEQVTGVLLEAPFSSLIKLVGERVPWVPSALLRYPFDSAQRLQSYNGPVLIIHGNEDQVIPVIHGRSLAASRPPEVSTYLEIEGAHHDNLATFTEYWTAITWLLGGSK